MAVWLADPKSGLNCLKQKDPDGCLEKCSSCNNGSGVMIDDKEIQGCPMDLISARSAQYLDAHWFLKEFHILPNPGGRDNQPAKFIEVVRIIESEISKILKKNKEVSDGSA